MHKLTINGKSIEAPDGATILETAKRAGIRIPTLCFLEKREPIGACRDSGSSARCCAVGAVGRCAGSRGVLWCPSRDGCHRSAGAVGAHEAFRGAATDGHVADRRLRRPGRQLQCPRFGGPAGG